MALPMFHIADRVLNRPLLIMPEKLAIIGEVLAGRIGLDASAVAALVPEASRFEGEQAFEQVSGGKERALPYRRNADGTAIVTVIGSLVNRGAWIGASSGLVSYEGLTFQIQKAAKDPATKAIVLDMQSPGGEAVGAFECAAFVRAVAKEKPVIAVVNGMAASAAYAIASACRAIVSIGVVMMHTDYSRAIDKARITPTLVHAGAHKVDGNPYQPLPAGVKSDLQAEVDAFYEKFLETVAAGRGKRLTAKAARATEARCLIGRDALAAGLVDDIGTFADVISNIRKFDVMTRSSFFSASLPPAPFAKPDRASFAASPTPPPPRAVSWTSIADELNMSSTPTNRSLQTEALPATLENDPHGWNAIIHQLNSETSRRTESPSPTPESVQKVPGLRGAISWAAVAEILNAEAAETRRSAGRQDATTPAPNQSTQAGAVSWSAIADQLNTEAKSNR